jgi:ketosteroid isomerase-like protein
MTVAATGSRSSPLALVRRYLDAIEQNAEEAELSSYFAPDVEQWEFPNRLLPNGARRGLQELLEGSRKGKQAVKNQRYEVLNALVDGDRVALELIWTAELLVPLGTLRAGEILRARCAMFFQVHGGFIARQHNFDCFDPF